MSKVESHQGLMPSLVDRLIDSDSGGTADRRGYSLQQMMDSVRRDVEDLLNTRASYYGISGEFPEVAKSVAAYGFPDFGSLRTGSRSDHQAIARLIAEVVMAFEPRLKEVKAVLVEDLDSLRKFSLKYQIHGKLRVEPSPEVAFETVLELASGHTFVKKGGR